MSETPLQISTHSHNLVVDSDGNIIIDEEGNCLLSRVADGHVEAVEPEVIKQVFGMALSPIKMNYLSSLSSTPVDQNISSWNRDNILKLCSLYKEHSHLFKTTTIRNEKVWTMIAKEMRIYSSEQCKNKFKYLKAKYIKKKDNMSAKATGQKKINFEYFEELDEIFGKDPNVTPLSIASSSQDTQKESESDSKEEIPIHSEKKSKMTKDYKENQKENAESKHKLTVAGQLQKIAVEMKQREQNRERRHKEMLEQKERGITVLNTYLTYLMQQEQKN